MQGMRTKFRWVTLRNGRRVQIDEHGRILKGISKEARGVHVRDLVPFMAETRELAGTDCSVGEGGVRYRRCRGGAEILRDGQGRPIRARFASKKEAVAALLNANPQLYEFVQQNWGSDSQAFKDWLRRGQRGPKPQLGPGDGRFDPINVRFGLEGYRRCSSFLEALYVTIPSTCRWEDITPDRLWPLAECVGFELQPPEESLRLPIAREATTECEDEKKSRHDDLIGRARGGRLPPRDVPF